MPPRGGDGAYRAGGVSRTRGCCRCLFGRAIEPCDGPQRPDLLVHRRHPVHPRHGVADEVRHGPALLAGKLPEPAVDGFVKVELGSHHAMYLHRQQGIGERKASGVRQ